MATSASTEKLMTRIMFDEVGTGAEIAYYLETEPTEHKTYQPSQGICIYIPKKYVHLVTCFVSWKKPTKMRGWCSFELVRDKGGQDIPKYLPEEVRYHLLMTSAGVFEYLADMTS